MLLGLPGFLGHRTVELGPGQVGQINLNFEIATPNPESPP